jgi:hypothetical protein
MKITKLTASSISVSKKVITPTTTTYEYDYLIKQRASIEAQKAQQIADRDRELAEIDELLGECAKLNVVANPIEEIKQITTK